MYILYDQFVFSWFLSKVSYMSYHRNRLELIKKKHFLYEFRKKKHCCFSLYINKKFLQEIYFYWIVDLCEKLFLLFCNFRSYLSWNSTCSLITCIIITREAFPLAICNFSVFFYVGMVYIIIFVILVDVTVNYILL